MEDTIIFGLIERAQFKQNINIYKTPYNNTIDKSYLDYFLEKIEQVHAQVGRYTSPDEHPFTPLANLPKPVFGVLDYPKVLNENNINYNDKIKSIYRKIIEKICQEGDDSNYGSSSTKDVELLQALSRRIHFGKFVAEAKFNDPSKNALYRQLIQSKNEKGILDLLTNLKVEEKLKKRLRLKVLMYGQEVNVGDDEDGDGGKMGDIRINGFDLVYIYDQIVIPMTKEVELDYLMSRLDSDFVSVEFYK
jgi:chorismate mutase